MPSSPRRKQAGANPAALTRYKGTDRTDSEDHHARRRPARCQAAARRLHGHPCQPEAASASSTARASTAIGEVFEDNGLSPGREMALAAAATEIAGGVLTITGIADPAGPLAVAGAMAVAAALQPRAAA